MHYPRQTELYRTSIATMLCLSCLGLSIQRNERPRARDIGLTIGVLPVGPLNAITDVAGVRVGHTTQYAPRDEKLLSNDAMSPLFLAVIESTEEAVYNLLLKATTITGRGHTVEALPIDRTIEILRKHGALRR